MEQKIGIIEIISAIILALAIIFSTFHLLFDVIGLVATETESFDYVWIGHIILFGIIDLFLVVGIVTALKFMKKQNLAAKIVFC